MPHCHKDTHLAEATNPPTIPPPDKDKRGDLNLAIFRPLLTYVEKEFGREALTRFSSETGIPEDVLLRAQSWVMLSEVEKLLALTRELLGSDARFLEACAYDVVRSYGPLALVFRASTPLTSYKVLARTVHFASRISSYELEETSGHSVVLRYRSTKPESRLMCMSRQAQLPTMPLIWWGLTPARLRESKCIARGDDCCEYELKWSAPLAWRWPLVGALLGGAVALVARYFGVAHVGLYPLITGLVGAMIAFRRMVVQAHDFHEDTTERVGVLVKDNEAAVEEVMALHSRQEAFNSLMAERIEARTGTLEAMLTEIESTRARSEVALRGLSHDMNNPLQVAKILAHVVSESDDKDTAESGREIGEAVIKVEAQMKRLLDIATAADSAFALNTNRLEISGFVDRVRKNLQALAIARDIRISVFRTREAPEFVETDTLLFDRVIDNLISNAVKYTERGSIVVEIGGSPGQLAFKISDTGRGISPERLEKVFIGGLRDAKPLLGESHGIGLSNTIRLLDELSGRLEVMSKPNVGTTIWAYLPITPPKRDARPMRAVDVQEMLKRVVTIRSVANG